MPLSWNEIRNRAHEFSKRWEDETSEDAEAKSFWTEFFNIFGIAWAINTTTTALLLCNALSQTCDARPWLIDAMFLLHKLLDISYATCV